MKIKSSKITENYNRDIQDVNSLYGNLMDIYEQIEAHTNSTQNEAKKPAQADDRETNDTEIVDSIQAEDEIEKDLIQADEYFDNDNLKETVFETIELLDLKEESLTEGVKFLINKYIVLKPAAQILIKYKGNPLEVYDLLGKVEDPNKLSIELKKVNKLISSLFFLKKEFNNYSKFVEKNSDKIADKLVGKSKTSKTSKKKFKNSLLKNLKDSEKVYVKITDLIDYKNKSKNLKTTKSKFEALLKTQSQKALPSTINLQKLKDIGKKIESINFGKNLKLKLGNKITPPLKLIEFIENPKIELDPTRTKNVLELSKKALKGYLESLLRREDLFKSTTIILKEKDIPEPERIGLEGFKEDLTTKIIEISLDDLESEEYLKDPEVTKIMALLDRLKDEGLKNEKSILFVYEKIIEKKLSTNQIDFFKNFLNPSVLGQIDFNMWTSNSELKEIVTSISNSEEVSQTFKKELESIKLDFSKAVNSLEELNKIIDVKSGKVSSQLLFRLKYGLNKNKSSEDAVLIENFTFRNKLLIKGMGSLIDFYTIVIDLQERLASIISKEGLETLKDFIETSGVLEILDQIIKDLEVLTISKSLIKVYTRFFTELFIELLDKNKKRLFKKSNNKFNLLFRDDLIGNLKSEGPKLDIVFFKKVLITKALGETLTIKVIPDGEPLEDAEEFKIIRTEMLKFVRAEAKL